jgi:hypothetical protein
MLGAYGGVAVAVVFLFVHLLNEQSRKDATVGPEQPKVATDTGLPQWSPTTASPGQAAPSQPAPVQPKSASSRPSPYSPSGVRQMTPEEKARRKNRINSFAEMGRAAEAELRNDDSQTPTN